jgi:hypothetical protein
MPLQVINQQHTCCTCPIACICMYVLWCIVQSRCSATFVWSDTISEWSDTIAVPMLQLCYHKHLILLRHILLLVPVQFVRYTLCTIATSSCDAENNWFFFPSQPFFPDLRWENMQALRILAKFWVPTLFTLFTHWTICWNGPFAKNFAKFWSPFFFWPFIFLTWDEKIRQALRILAKFRVPFYTFEQFVEMDHSQKFLRKKMWTPFFFPWSKLNNYSES